MQGIRVDHPDGLRDPGEYLQRLHDAAPDAWLVVEKILEPGEEMPDWPVAGTTGYDALAEVCGVFVDPGTEAFFDTLDHHLTGGEKSWQDLVHGCKFTVATTLLAAELARMARLVPEIEAAPRALAELAACFPVYRSYLPFGSRHLAKGAVRGRSPAAPADPGAGPAHRPAAQPAGRAGRAVPAVHRRGDGQGRGGHRVLPVDPVHRPQRGGQRPGQVRRPAGRVPRGRRRTARMAGGNDHAVHPRHQAQRGRAGPARVLAELPGDWTEVVRRWVGSTRCRTRRWPI